MVFSRRWHYGLKAARVAAPLLKPPPEPHPHRFVLLSTPRSGTTWAIDLLDSHPQVVCFSEIFAHDHFGNMPHGGCQDATTWDSYATLKLPHLGRLGRLRLYFTYLDQEIYSPRHGASAVGFKMMYVQAQRGFAIPAYLKLRKVSIVHLIRCNHLDVLLSEEARKVRKYYHAPAGADVAPVQIHVEPDTLAYRLEQRQQAIQQARQAFSQLGAPYLEIAYEDLLQDPSPVADILEFLSVESAPRGLDSPLAKLNTTDHRQLIQNYDQVERALCDTRFGELLR